MPSFRLLSPSVNVGVEKRPGDVIGSESRDCVTSLILLSFGSPISYICWVFSSLFTYLHSCSKK